jgi:parallel beta-helix repeat protein/predicted outer membrane repeat protein
MSIRSFATVLALGLLVGVSIVQSASSARYPCLVTNERTRMVSRSLQQAVDAAAAEDTLLVKGTCFGASTITKDLTLQGVSNKQFGVATLDGGGGTVLSIGALDRATVAIDDLTITHGGLGILVDGLVGSTVNLTRTSVSNNYGSGIEADFSSVLLTDSTVSGNPGAGLFGDRSGFGLLRSTVRDNGGSGVGVGNGSVSVEDSTVSGNGLGGIGVGGEFGDAIVSGSTVSDNDGPGIQLFAATLTLTNSSVSGNTTSGSGGGIYAFEGNGYLTNSTVTGNTAGQNGGGIYMAPGSFRLNNSTVSGNTAGADGGGIYLTSTSSDLTLSDSTVSGNTAASGGGIFNDGGSVTLTGTNSFFDNVPEDCVGVAGC